MRSRSANVQLRPIVLGWFCALSVLIGAEVLAQSVYRFATGVLFFDRQIRVQPFELHPYLVGRPISRSQFTYNNKTITILADHTRWTGAPQIATNSIRVAVLGGSTTFGTNVSDKDSWPAILQATLGKKYAIKNYGVPGYTTVEAIIQTALIVPEFAPHIIVFYVGWNDLKNYFVPGLGPDYFRHGIEQYNNLNIQGLLRSKESLGQWLTKASVISAVIKRLIQLIEIKSGHELMQSNLQDQPDPSVDRLYLRNLLTLRNLALGSHAYTVFVPQVLNIDEFHGSNRSRPWSPFIRDDSLPRLMDHMNQLMKGICADRASSCAFVDRILTNSWTPAHFVDDGHFNRAGGLEFVRVLEPYIRAVFK